MNRVYGFGFRDRTIDYKEKLKSFPKCHLEADSSMTRSIAVRVYSFYMVFIELSVLQSCL